MCLFTSKQYSGMYENLGYNNDKTLMMLKEQFLQNGSNCVLYDHQLTFDILL